MKPFNTQIFIISTGLFAVLLIPGFIATWAAEEGTMGTSMAGFIFSRVFMLLRFPTHTLLWSFFSGNGPWIYFAGLLINCALFAVITERIFSLANPNKLPIYPNH